MRVHQGLERGVAHEILADYLLGFWKDHLEDHFEQEEKILVPALPASPETEALVSRLREDHDEVRGLLDRLKEDTSPKGELLEEISTKIKNHIRFEERELFPYAERSIEPTALEKVGELLSENHRPADLDTSPKFWE